MAATGQDDPFADVTTGLTQVMEDYSSPSPHRAEGSPGPDGADGCAGSAGRVTPITGTPQADVTHDYVPQSIRGLSSPWDPERTTSAVKTDHALLRGLIGIADAIGDLRDAVIQQRPAPSSIVCDPSAFMRALDELRQELEGEKEARKALERRVSELLAAPDRPMKRKRDVEDTGE
ncbi:hypothetical protein AURDEDRAFT_177500 [Auricularia subglabra TFB-10046 SS5]|uniref:Uncharacterized protein n=1 Tax=Auricularia subglabra (strain TFB-10046 / SS5) TaxID=717982 RepID=J0CT01_AURST|nr:hypothetical protein AURDEDRAFT_177500 [Auricularia subglabra TFB-10046 SS5]